MSLRQAGLSRFLLTKQLPSKALFVGDKNNMGAEELLTAYAAGERNFSGADLSRADLEDAIGANLHGARRW